MPKGPSIRERFEAEVGRRGGEVVGDYVDARKQVALRCSEGHVWNALPCNIAWGRTWCPECHRRNPVLREMSAAAERRFREAVSLKGGTVVGTYKGTNHRVRVRCTRGHEWDALPNSVLCRGTWCPCCAKRGYSPGAEAAFRELVESRGGAVVGKYRTGKTHVAVKCRKCGHEWEQRPDKLPGRQVFCHACGNDKADTKMKTTKDAASQVLTCDCLPVKKMTADIDKSFVKGEFARYA